jgi:cytochrome c biogenesis protein CcdA
MKVKLMTGLILMLACLCYGEIIFSPPSWELGAIERDKILELKLTIENKEKEVLTVQIIPTCDCAWSEPSELTIQPGAVGNVLLFFDPHDETGDIDKNFIIKTNRKEMERVFYLIHGKITYGIITETEGKDTAEQDTGKKQVELYYYYSPSCAHCRNFIDITIPRIEKEMGIDITLITKDIMDTNIYQEIKPKLDSLGEEERAFPILFIGNTVLQGEGEIDGRIRNELKAYLSGSTSFPGEGQGTGSDTSQSGTGATETTIAIIPAITAGLLDGINPCAFATLISLLTALALAGKRKKEILIIGIFFTLSVFSTYYLVGLGFFKVIQTAKSFPLVSQIIHWILIAILFLFAALSIYDYYLIKVGRTGDMILQLPDSFKKRIQNTIKTRVRSAAIVASSIILGFLVSIFELGCTGQVYFPFITVNVLKIEKEAFGYVLLLIYNLCFILPLVLVFSFTYLGISSKKVTNVFQKNMGTVKLLLAGLFLGLAVYLIFSK